jgi:hypothetical protein
LHYVVNRAGEQDDPETRQPERDEQQADDTADDDEERGWELSSHARLSEK